jgi:hypothetical protein
MASVNSGFGAVFMFQAQALAPLDLHDAAFMDDELDGAEAQAVESGQDLSGQGWEGGGGQCGRLIV